MGRRVALVLVLMIVAGVAVWAAFHIRATRRDRLIQSTTASFTPNTASADWNLAVEQVKAERDASLGGALDIPPELRHYEERHWFLATQVAEVEKYKVHTVQDYLDLAAMLERHELLPVAAVTDTYILFGVGQRANEEPFEPFQEDDQNTNAEPKAVPPEAYQPLQNLARSFNGRSYDLNNPSDRYALKVNMLSSIRPQALKIIEQVASAYHSQFARLLPVSSLVRPEQYQHALRRVNRNAVTIDTPPHSTGLAFDIDYRYMSVAEQNFLMRELARLKSEGRIEVIRERSANYHVFAFINGTRPSDDLVSASLEKAGAPPKEEEAHHTEAKPAKADVKSKVSKSQRSKPKARSPQRVSRKRRH